MLGWVAATDYTWYQRLREDGLERGEVNFWRPSELAPKKNMPVGMPFFFKLKVPHNAICGFGYFYRFSALPDWLAWDSFGRRNGVASLDELRQRLGRLRAGANIPKKPVIGCCLIAEAEVWPEQRWIRQPNNWGATTVVGATYDLREGEGLRIWNEATEPPARRPRLPSYAEESPPRYGAPTLVRPRLGQGIFRVLVLEAYDRACAVTGEHSLPVLDTAHIRPFAEGGEHHVDNGLSLRVDLHRLFDRGYVTFDEQRRLVVSRRLREDFENGKTYYAMQGTALRESMEARPEQALTWHRDHVFR
jgi:putative restriction endonuclease